MGWKEPSEVIQSNEQGHLEEDHVPQSPLEPDLESSQEWGIYSLSRQLVPVVHNLNFKEVAPHI